MTNNKKIIIAGSWSFEHYEESFAIGLRKNNFEVIPFKTSDFIKGKFSKFLDSVPINFLSMLKINIALIALLKKEKVKYLLCWRCICLFPSTIKYINSLGVVTLSYNNDDPFSPKSSNFIALYYYMHWFWYKKSIKYFKCNFFYRKINIQDSKLFGSKDSKLLLPYFLPWKDFPQKLNQAEKKQYSCDVVFIGHYENDGRVDYLRDLVKNDINVKLYGEKIWTKNVLGTALYDYFKPINPVYGLDYAKALSGANICLVFLSKLNRDLYTRRCFEIPATGSLMLAERTVELTQFFKEDKEACFFSSSSELVDKVNWLLENPSIIKKISKAGLEKVYKDNHDVISRASDFIQNIEKY